MHRCPLKTALGISLSATLLCNACNAFGQVKQSRSGICHDGTSLYYESVQRHTDFASLQDCLSAGGRLPKTSKTPHTPTEPGGYSRDKFGKGWADNDGDCQNSRHEALIAQSTAPVRFKSERKCRVSAGRWISPYTGAIIHDPPVIDIDHVVPLAWAWAHGADQWEQSTRERFANDPANLVSVEAALNRAKGAQGPDTWLPPQNQCQYIARFVRVTKSYRLNLTPAENTAFKQLTDLYCR